MDSIRCRLDGRCRYRAHLAAGGNRVDVCAALGSGNFASGSAGLLAWSLSGIAQLVGITKFHGEMRLELFAHMQDARRLLRDRKKQDRPA